MLWLGVTLAPWITLLFVFVAMFPHLTLFIHFQIILSIARLCVSLFPSPFFCLSPSSSVTETPFVASNEITVAVSAEIHTEAIKLTTHRVVCTQPSQVLGNRVQDGSRVSHTLRSQDGSETFLDCIPSPSLCRRWCLMNQFLPGKQVCSRRSQCLTCGRC